MTELQGVAPNGNGSGSGLRVAVTGGAGFIGSHVVDLMVAAGHRMTVLDVRPPHRDDVAFALVDIDDVDGLVAALAGIDVVLHLAGVSNVNDAFDRPARHRRPSTSPARPTCGRRPAATDLQRAVLASTVWVYAGADEDRPLDEEAPFHLPGGRTHLHVVEDRGGDGGAQLHRALRRALHHPALRHPLRAPDARRAASSPASCGRALAGEPITINGDGQQFRNWVYVADLADAHLRILADAGRNEVFNLEGRERVSVRQLVDTLRTLLGEHAGGGVPPGPGGRLRRAGGLGGQGPPPARVGGDHQVRGRPGRVRGLVPGPARPRGGVAVRPVTAALAGAGILTGAHAGPSVASLGQWLPVRAIPGGWCTWRGPRRDTVALTFDDGPDPDTTWPIVERLDELEVRASFFVRGPAAERHPDVVAALVARGHTVAVHGYDHVHHLVRPPGWIARDTALAALAVGTASGGPLRWYRPPYGQMATASARSARRHGMRTVLWSAWGREWATSDAGDVVARVLSGVGPGAIVLLHDSDDTCPPGTARLVLDALGPLVTELRGRGLGPVTLDEMLGP